MRFMRSETNASAAVGSSSKIFYRFPVAKMGDTAAVVQVVRWYERNPVAIAIVLVISWTKVDVLLILVAGVFEYVATDAARSFHTTALRFPA